MKILIILAGMILLAINNLALAGSTPGGGGGMSVPEPSTLSLLAVGIAAVVGIRYFKNKK